MPTSSKIKYTDSTFSSHQMDIFAAHPKISRYFQNYAICSITSKGAILQWPCRTCIHTEMQIYHEVASWKEKHTITYQLHNLDLNLHPTVCTPLSTSGVRWGYCLMWQLSLDRTGNRTDPVTKWPHCLSLQNIQWTLHSYLCKYVLWNQWLKVQHWKKSAQLLRMA